MWLGTSILSNKHSEYTKLDYVAVLPGQAVAICKPRQPVARAVHRGKLYARACRGSRRPGRAGATARQRRPRPTRQRGRRRPRRSRAGRRGYSPSSLVLRKHFETFL